MKPERSLSDVAAMMTVVVIISCSQVVCSDPKFPADPVHIGRKREHTWSISSATWCLCTFCSARSLKWCLPLIVIPDIISCTFSFPSHRRELAVGYMKGKGSLLITKMKYLVRNFKVSTTHLSFGVSFNN